MKWTRSLDGGRMATTRFLALTIVAVAIAFAISQFRYYLAKVRLPDELFPGETAREKRFLKRQAWRRLQIAALSGLAGGCLLAGIMTPYDVHITLFTLAWLGFVFFGVWVIALALVDGFMTWLYFSIDRSVHKAEGIALRAEMDKFRDDCLREIEEEPGKEEKKE